MSHHTLAIIGLIVYWALAYASSLVRPRNCSEHVTQEQKYKYAVFAPFWAIFSVALFIYLVWSAVVLVTNG